MMMRIILPVFIAWVKGLLFCLTITKALFVPPGLVSQTQRGHGIDYHHLPHDTVFPGPWDRYIQAPANKSYITPARVWRVAKNVEAGFKVARGESEPDEVPFLSTNTDENVEKQKFLGNPGADEFHIRLMGGGLVTFEFEQNIAGRVCFEVLATGSHSTDNPAVLYLAYSESSLFAGKRTDATNDEEWDLPITLHIGDKTGTICVDDLYLRGAFKYLTVYIPKRAPPYGIDKANDGNEANHQPWPWVEFKRLWVNCTAFPSQPNGRAYSGYFYSSSNLLNRIWYAGAYTLQLSTIDPKEGSSLIPVNRRVDRNTAPPGSWFSNFTVSKGNAVTTDGAKRDRLVWPGDMYIAIPGIAMSTYDMLAVKNALDVMYEIQNEDGRLPYAGPPIGSREGPFAFSNTYHLHTLLGTYEYVMFSGDIAWLREKWPKYLAALRTSIAKVDSKGLMGVVGDRDWNRKTMNGHHLEPTSILHAVLGRSIKLASFVAENQKEKPQKFSKDVVAEWHALRERLALGIQALWCADSGLYSDNREERHCFANQRLEPQDGNSWTLISRMTQGDSSIPMAMSNALRARWNKFGAPATEFPNTMSPFASSFELQAHVAADNHDAAVELMLLMWGYLLDGPGFTNSTLAEGFRTDGYLQYPAYPHASRNSHAHGWASGPTSVLMTGILGITLDTPLGKRWTISPELTSWLGWVRGGFAVKGGTFEVKLTRVLLMSADGSHVEKRGIVAVINTPEGSKGRFGWGDGIVNEKKDTDGMLHHIEVVGGARKAWVRWDGEFKTAKPVMEELDVSRGTWAESDGDEWYAERIPYKEGAKLVYDHSFREPVMEERQPGKISSATLKGGYMESWAAWAAQSWR